MIANLIQWLSFRKLDVKKPRCILLDIEGTTSSISFVYDVMFPYIREHLSAFLEKNWEAASVQDCLPLLANDLSFAGVSSWLTDDLVENQRKVAESVISLMDDDVKATGLKKLQGAIWKNGFESGQIVAHVYEDVLPAIERWKLEQIQIRIYSSGSVEAQRLFFGNCVAGNMLDHFSGMYDTTIGSKKDAASYTAIARDAQFLPEEILFVSDVVAELDAAESAGLQTLLSIRPGNPQQPENRHVPVGDFAEIKFEVSV